MASARKISESLWKGLSMGGNSSETESSYKKDLKSLPVTFPFDGMMIDFDPVYELDGKDGLADSLARIVRSSRMSSIQSAECCSMVCDDAGEDQVIKLYANDAEECFQGSRAIASTLSRMRISPGKKPELAPVTSHFVNSNLYILELRGNEKKLYGATISLRYNHSLCTFVLGVHISSGISAWQSLIFGSIDQKMYNGRYRLPLHSAAIKSIQYSANPMARLPIQAASPNNSFQSAIDGLFKSVFDTTC